MLTREDPSKAVFICDPGKHAEKHPDAWWFEKAMWAMSPAGQDSEWKVRFTQDIHLGDKGPYASKPYAALHKGPGMIVLEMHKFTDEETEVLRAQRRYWDLAKRFGV